MNKLVSSVILVIILLAGLLMSLSCGTSSPGNDIQKNPLNNESTGPDLVPETSVEVIIEDFTFSPATITIDVGTTVIWINRDFINHTVTSRTGIFDSGIMSRNAVYSRNFNDVGDFEYYCTLHPEMVGFIIVK